MASPCRVRTTDSRHGLPIAPNLIKRDFTAPAPNRIWLADITYIPTAEGWLFHTLKTELVHHRQYKTRAEAQRDIFAFIEGFYNRTRLHSAIGYTIPIAMEIKAA